MKNLFRSADRRLAGVAVVSVLLLAPLGIFGGSALAHSASGAGPSAAQYQYKVTICHRTHSKKHPWHVITISNRALKAHLRHGDKFPPPCPTTALATTKHHGNSSEQHGKSSEHHGNNGHHGKS